MAAHAFWAVFSSSRQQSQISPTTAENDGAAMPLLFLLLNFSYFIAYQESTEEFTNLGLSFGPYAY